LAIPVRLCAFGFGRIAIGRGSQLAAQHRFLLPYFYDDCVELISGFVQSAVGGIVPVPRCVRVKRIELREDNWRHSSTGTIDEEPSTTLPHPLGRLARLCRKSVVDAKCAADHKD